MKGTNTVVKRPPGSHPQRIYTEPRNVTKHHCSHKLGDSLEWRKGWTVNERLVSRPRVRKEVKSGAALRRKNFGFWFSPDVNGGSLGTPAMGTGNPQPHPYDPGRASASTM